MAPIVFGVLAAVVQVLFATLVRRTLRAARAEAWRDGVRAGVHAANRATEATTAETVFLTNPYDWTFSAVSDVEKEWI